MDKHFLVLEITKVLFALFAVLIFYVSSPIRLDPKSLSAVGTLKSCRLTIN